MYLVIGVHHTNKIKQLKLKNKIKVQTIPITINSLSILLVKTVHFLVVNFVKRTAIKELTSFG
jgi:hypothetical protein